jgi:hypothetical protein
LTSGEPAAGPLADEEGDATPFPLPAAIIVLKYFSFWLTFVRWASSNDDKDGDRPFPEEYSLGESPKSLWAVEVQPPMRIREIFKEFDSIKSSKQRLKYLIVGKTLLIGL